MKFRRRCGANSPSLLVLTTPRRHIASEADQFLILEQHYHFCPGPDWSYRPISRLNKCGF